MNKLLSGSVKINPILISCLIFLIAATIIGQNLNKPFAGIHDWNGARYGNIARNYLRYGLVQTKLGQVENSAILSSDQFQYLTHYPPLLPLTIAISYQLFGISEWATRLPALLFTAGCLVLLFLVGNHLLGIAGGILAAFLALSTPLILYFGKNPVHEPPLVFFVLLAFYGYLKKRHWIFVSGLSLAHLTTWAGYFLLPALIITQLVKRNFLEVFKLLPYLVIPVLFFLIHLLAIFLLTGSILGGDLQGVLLQRSGLSQSGQLANLNILSYLNQIRLWVTTLYGPIITLLVVFFLISLSKIDDNRWQILSLGIFGAIYPIIFSNAFFLHNYLSFYLLPFLILAAAGGLLKLLDQLALPKLSLIIILMVVVVNLWERANFLNALNASAADRLAVEIGQTIRKQSLPNQLVLITPANFQYAADNFLKFYSDRQLIYADNPPLNFDLWVRVDQTDGKFEIIKEQ